MGGLFNMDNVFFTTIGKLVDIIFISLIWILLCIPIVTIGPATTALYYVIVKVIRRERGYLWREFFHSFKANFKYGAIAGMIIFALSIILAFDAYFAFNLGGTQGIVLLCLFTGMVFITGSVTIYIFPILSRFQVGIKQLFKTSLFMSIRHLPTTILLIIIVAVSFLATFILPVLVLVIPAGCCFICSLLIERILKKYMPEKENDEESNGVDEWYLE